MSRVDRRPPCAYGHAYPGLSLEHASSRSLSWQTAGVSAAAPQRRFPKRHRPKRASYPIHMPARFMPRKAQADTCKAHPCIAWLCKRQAGPAWLTAVLLFSLSLHNHQGRVDALLSRLRRGRLPRGRRLRLWSHERHVRLLQGLRQRTWRRVRWLLESRRYLRRRTHLQTQPDVLPTTRTVRVQ